MRNELKKRKGKMAFKSLSLRAVCASVLSFGLATSAGAATLQLDFGTSFGDPFDPDTAAPDGPGPWLTAFFDDGGTTGSVSLTLSVAGTVGGAEVSQVYLNVDDAIGGANLTITANGGTGPAANSILKGTDAFKADADGWYDILFDLPPPGGDRFGAGETLTYDITGIGLVASSFNFLSTPDLVDPNGPFLGAAKFQSTGVLGEQSDWVGAVPIPAAVWLFGSGLIGLVGLARRKA